MTGSRAIPTPGEVAVWRQKLENGQALPGFIDHLIESYNQLWGMSKVLTETNENGWVVAFDDVVLMEHLEVLAALLDGPVVHVAVKRD